MSDKVKKDIESTVDDLSEDEELLIYYDREQHERAVMNSALTAERIAKEELENAKINKYNEGFEHGTQKGIEKEKLEIAKKMLEEKIEINIISKITGFSIDFIKSL